jgi:Cu(I)/Ag(I) efflux system membrane protein CusA/SilA
VKLPPAIRVSWSGQFEYLERATERLKLVVPATLAVIFVLLYLLFRSFNDAALVMAAVPFSLIGGFWLIWAWATTSRWPRRSASSRWPASRPSSAS